MIFNRKDSEKNHNEDRDHGDHGGGHGGDHAGDHRDHCASCHLLVSLDAVLEYDKGTRDVASLMGSKASRSPPVGVGAAQKQTETDFLCVYKSFKLHI